MHIWFIRIYLILSCEIKTKIRNVLLTLIMHKDNSFIFCEVITFIPLWHKIFLGFVSLVKRFLSYKAYIVISNHPYVEHGLKKFIPVKKKCIYIYIYYVYIYIVRLSPVSVYLAIRNIRSNLNMNISCYSLKSFSKVQSGIQP